MPQTLSKDHVCVKMYVLLCPVKAGGKKNTASAFLSTLCIFVGCLEAQS